ncbi:energy-coupling factor ABC transporter ATP-binding protein [Sporolactobacillus sp. KGMB 08714]|uniref:energy-coupling factor ABC transporter ATP-binding protein n=1 Tax=Sporolactobacillus sp. KGMB 08714 TaxID=3064704 RepID=UPI002FBEED8B
MIQLDHVSYTYDDSENALADISLNIADGASLALIGANGSGKSTLMKIISGLTIPSSGVYRLNNEEITEKKLKDPRFSRMFHKQIGFVFQNSETQLFCSNVWEEIAFGPLQMGLTVQDVQARVTEIMDLLEISHLKKRPPYHLSGGEQKRVAIAATAVMNPDVYLFDEPMNNLDPKNKSFLRQFISRLNQSGKTIICSTHDFAYVDDLFQKAAVFSETHQLIRLDDYSSVLADRDFLAKMNII